MTLEGATTLADKLHRFRLFQCEDCGHVQKHIDSAWLDVMDSLYKHEYAGQKVAGHQIEVVDGRIIDRSARIVSEIDRLLSLGHGGALLDIGCSSGSFLATFAELKPGWSLAGYDVGETHRPDIEAIPRATYHTGPLDADGKFYDLVTMTHVAEHLPDPVAMFETAARLLAPGGRLIVRVPCYLEANPDFYIYEHCSHFVPDTLKRALITAGYRIVHDISHLANVEIGFIAERGTQDPVLADVSDIRRTALGGLVWARKIPDYIRANAKGRKIGIYGVGGAGLWLGTRLKGDMAFYVDDDPSKQGHSFADCPIVSTQDIPEGSVVFVTLNNYRQASRVAERARAANPSAVFLVPPA